MTIAELLTTSKINDKNIISHLKQMISIAIIVSRILKRYQLESWHATLQIGHMM
jgi:hypothetical protein